MATIGFPQTPRPDATELNASHQDPTGSDFDWTGVPVVFRYGVLLCKTDGSELRAVNLTAYADKVDWYNTDPRKPGVIHTTTALGNGANANGHFRAPGANQNGVVLYQVDTTSADLPIIFVFQVASDPASATLCSFNAGFPIFVNVNDVASGNDVGGDLSAPLGNYAFADNEGSFDLHIQVTGL